MKRWMMLAAFLVTWKTIQDLPGKCFGTDPYTDRKIEIDCGRKETVHMKKFTHFQDAVKFYTNGIYPESFSGCYGFTISEVQ